MKQFERYLLVLTVSIAIVGIIGLIPKIISVLLLVSACIYLFAGWKFFSPAKKEKPQLIPFLISYLIAQTIVTVLFGINNYPLKDTFAYITTGMLLIATLLILVYNKTLTRDYPDNRYLVIVIACIFFSVAPLWMGIVHGA